ncbi:hypothetical protein HY990_06705 [Candidatus Micrarchaeota archaeon]|nr:hypothetical protein [Candidatus Micrarchaeota archaeon]
MKVLRRSQKPPMPEQPQVQHSILSLMEEPPIGRSFVPIDRKVLFGEDFLVRFARVGKSVSGYRIEHDESDGFSCGYGKLFGDPKRKTHYYDKHLAAVITKDERPLACASYDDRDGVLTISQIQGTYGEEELQKNLRWEKALIFAIEELAKKMPWVRKLVVIGAKNSMYSEVKGLSEPGEEGYLRYDVTARRCGFKKNDETGNYEKAIKRDSE